MQVMLNIPDKIPQAVINKLVMQFEEQIQAMAFNVSQTEPQKNKLSKRQAGLGGHLIADEKSTPKRCSHPDIAGRMKIMGDIINTATQAEWDLPI